MTSLIERAAERLRSETTGKRHLIPANADTPDPLAAAIATAEDYDRFSAGLIGSPPAILATVQRDMAALAAAHMERIRDEPQMDMREAKAIVRIVLTAIREPSEAMKVAGGTSIAGQFTDPWDVLSSREEEALGLEVDGDDAYLGANDRLAPYASEAWQSMIDAALGEA